MIPPKHIEFFEKKIRPVLVEHCYECHAAKSKTVRGGLLLDSAIAFRKGGDSGPAFVAGEPGAGTLIDALRHETFEMPPQQKLSNAIINDFAKWIEIGAPDPRVQKEDQSSRNRQIDLAAGREFWSFRPIAEPTIPDVDDDWSNNEIDHFIRAAQREKNLEPGLAAAPLTALRRLYFDLTGIPPTVEQIHKFEKSNPETRWLETVDELLASRQFGERWGRHWLDLARYSNSTGGGRSLLYGESWRYRNYVIDSLNADKPFDQFIREQIAGDLLSAENHKRRQQQVIATGFLALGPHNYENQDKEQLRMDIVDEQIDTVGRVFLGMTIGCARCHDHKFDPIPTTDYYALAGIFRSTNSLVSGNVSKWVSTPIPISPQEQAERTEHMQAVAAVNKQIEKLQKKIENLKVGLTAILLDNLEAKLKGEWTESTFIKGYVNKNYQHSSDINASATFQFNVEPGEYEVQISYTAASNRSQQAKVSVLGSDMEKDFSINQRLQPGVDGTFHSLGIFNVSDHLNVVIRPTESAPTIIDAVRLVSLNESHDAVVQKAQKEIKDAESKMVLLQSELSELKATQPRKLPQIVSVEEHPESGDYQVCIRGNPHNLGQSVSRGFLSVATSKAGVQIPEGTSGRLELANWIASPHNPLTARVIVNRIWKHLFEVGLVRTVDNFGVPGEAPSHPQLLDYLATEFIENNWSMKQLIRKIVLSNTYQLASSTATHAADPENRLLTHQNKKRLTAEAIHDALLQVSGELDTIPANKTVKEGTKSEYGYQFDFGKRAIYLPVFRNRLPDVFAVFDFPNPNLPQGKRTSSNISPQSLFLMNSGFVYERSQLSAARVMKLTQNTDERLEWLSLAILNRYPTSDEQRILMEFVREEHGNQDRWLQVAQTLFGSLDFRFVQ